VIGFTNPDTWKFDEVWKKPFSNTNWQCISINIDKHTQILHMQADQVTWIGVLQHTSHFNTPPICSDLERERNVKKDYKSLSGTWLSGSDSAWLDI
jgi:hypothetical protein